MKWLILPTGDGVSMAVRLDIIQVAVDTGPGDLAGSYVYVRDREGGFYTTLSALKVSAAAIDLDACR